MSESRRILNNAKFLIAAEGFNVFAGVVYVVLLARLLCTADLGLYSFSFSVGSVMVILSLYGASQLITRQIARDPSSAQSYFGTSFIVRGFLSFILLPPVMFGLYAWGYPIDKCILIFFLIFTRLMEGLFFMLFPFFRGFQDMFFEGVARISLNILTMALGIPLLFTTRSLQDFAILQGTLTTIAFLITFVFATRRYQLRPFHGVNLQSAAQFLKSGFAFSLYTIFLAFYMQTNTILLSLFKGDEATGYYSAAFRFVSGFGLIASGIAGSFFPAISRLSLAADPENLRRHAKNCIRFLAFIGVLGGLVFYCFAPQLIHMVYGANFAESVLSLRIMAFTVAFSFVNTATSTVLFSIDREKQVLLMFRFVVLFVIAINLILLPPYGAIGASITTIVPEIVCFYLQSRMLSRALPGLELWPLTFRFAALAALVALLASGQFLH
jgi:O-antigen/teichoic acid export membrane protein